MASLIRPVQRVGGWSDADLSKKTAWNAGEQAVGAIRRIPIDGLVQGLQDNPREDGAKELTIEHVAGPVKGAPRSDTAEQKGKGRAIALIHHDLNPTLPIDVLFHLHGHTEKKSRDFAGWRQHKTTGEVRDVHRDRIAQQIEDAKSPQLMGILPQGVNESQFGSISPDTYIADALDRLVEIGALKQLPKQFRVVLSAHSGGGISTIPMVTGGAKAGRPQNLAMVVLFEAIIWKQLKEIRTWALDELNRHLKTVKGPMTDTEKREQLASATRMRAYFDPDGSYSAKYDNLRKAIEGWKKDHKAELGSFFPAVDDLFRVIEQKGVGAPTSHEGQVAAGLGDALGALGAKSGWQPAGGGAPAPRGSSGAAVPSGTTGATPVPASSAPLRISLAAREAAITADMVGRQVAGSAPFAGRLFHRAKAGGVGRLRAAAMALSSTGINNEIDLTDALFALVHPELAGARIPTDREDLKQDWRELRRTHARSAIQAVTAKPGPTTTAPGAGPASPTKTPIAVPPGTTTQVPPPKPPPAGGYATPEDEYAAFKAEVKAAFGKAGVKKYLAVRDLYEKRPETGGNVVGWLNQLEFGTPFCGSRLQGIHPKLTAVLAKIDEACTKLAAEVSNATKDAVPVVFEGKFQPWAVTGKPHKLSDHGLGLALHLNYKNNPYIGRNKAASALIERIAADAGHDDFWKSVKGKGKGTSVAQIESFYAKYAAASDAVAAYFRAMDVMQAAADAGTLDAAGQKELAKREKEYVNLRDSDLAKHRDPKDGFFAHTANIAGDPMLQIIKQLTSVAGLEWGGTYDRQAKDLHHFALKL